MQHCATLKTGSAGRMKKNFMLFLIAAVASGCVSIPIPFQGTPLVPLDARDPRSLVGHFQEKMPENFHLLTSVVFEYNERSFAAIGNLEINIKDRTFKVACLNPMGVKLFEISANDQGLTNHYTVAAITQYGDIATAVGNDIRRIYFDQLPSPGATVWKRTHEFIFRQYSGSGYLEYVFAGTEGDLIEKRFFENHQPVWCVSYYEYREQDGKRYPRGIILINYQYGYRLIVRHKGFSS
jgi:hypothetical protein